MERRTAIILRTQQCHPILALHRRRYAVPQKLRLGLELADDRYSVRRRCIEERRDRWMMGDLLRYVEPLRPVFVVVSTSKKFAQYGVISAYRS